METPKASRKQEAEPKVEIMEFPRDSSVDDFMEIVDSIDVVEVFHTAKSMTDQFMKLYHLPFLADYKPELGVIGKDKRLAADFMLEGKILQEERNLELSLEKLNEAVKLARPWSKELGCAYFERSTTLFHLGEYELSRKDGVRALKFNLSPDSKETILRRQITCREAVEEVGYERDIVRIKNRLESLQKSLGNPWPDKQASALVMKALQSAPRGVTPAMRRKNSQNDPRLPRMPGGRNSNIPATSDALTLAYTEEQGRYYMASRRILPGEVLSVENPLASALYTDCWKTHCYHCHRKTMAGIPCYTCSLIIFCGEHCRETAMKYHSIECNHMVELFDLGDGDGVLLAYRLIIQHHIDELLLWRPVLEPCFFAEPRRTEESTGKLLVCNELGSTFDLLTHHEETSPFYTLKAAKTSLFLVKCLEQTSYFGKYLNDEDVKQYVGRLLYHYLLVVVCNYFTASEVHLTTGPPFRAVTPPIAMNLYCAGSYFNHSCAPNVTHYFVNGRLICRSHQVIEPGEAVCISYGSSAHSEMLPDRRNFLWNGFHFICKCPACTGRWAPLRQLLLAYRGDLKFKVFDDAVSSSETEEETDEETDTTADGQTISDDDSEVIGQSHDLEDVPVRGVSKEDQALEKTLEKQIAEIREEIAREEEKVKLKTPSLSPTDGFHDGGTETPEPKPDPFVDLIKESKAGIPSEVAKVGSKSQVNKDALDELMNYQAEEHGKAKETLGNHPEKVMHVLEEAVEVTSEELMATLESLDKKRAVLKALLAEKQHRDSLLADGGKKTLLCCEKRSLGGSETRTGCDSVETENFEPDVLANGATSSTCDPAFAWADQQSMVMGGSEDVAGVGSSQRIQWTKELVSKLPMWPKNEPEKDLEESDSDSEDDNPQYVISGGFQCPMCHHKLEDVQNIPSLEEDSCPGCDIPFKPFVDKYNKVKQTSEEVRMLVEGGHFGRIHDAIESTGIYIQVLQSFALFPNLELLSTIVHLAHFFLLETVV